LIDPPSSTATVRTPRSLHSLEGPTGISDPLHGCNRSSLGSEPSHSRPVGPPYSRCHRAGHSPRPADGVSIDSHRGGSGRQNDRIPGVAAFECRGFEPSARRSRLHPYPTCTEPYAQIPGRSSIRTSEASEVRCRSEFRRAIWRAIHSKVSARSIRGNPLAAPPLTGTWMRAAKPRASGLVGADFVASEGAKLPRAGRAGAGRCQAPRSRVGKADQRAAREQTPSGVPPSDARGCPKERKAISRDQYRASLS